MELLCQTTQVNDRDARSFDTSLGEVIVAQKDGQFYAYKNNCPHLNVSLEFVEQQFMDADHEYLMCANHGALFQVESGLCVFGPCSGENLQEVPIVVKDGTVFLQP